MKDGIGENSGIKVDTITKNYGPLRVLAGISMTIPSQKSVAILGPSACGKTTFLSILADWSNRMLALSPASPHREWVSYKNPAYWTG